jgi:hypothetical protein
MRNLSLSCKGEPRWASILASDLQLYRQAKGVHTEEVDMADSEISIAQSENSGRFRLIIASKDGFTILSQECR